MNWHLRFGIAAEMPPVHALSLINKEAAHATEVQTDSKNSFDVYVP